MEPNRSRVAAALIRGVKTIQRRLEGQGFPVRQIGRSYVFRFSGSTCCIFGHIVEAAGLKHKLAPFRVRGTKEACWTTNRDVAHRLLGGDISGLRGILDDLEMANDVSDSKEARIAEIQKVLPALITALKEIR